MAKRYVLLEFDGPDVTPEGDAAAIVKRCVQLGAAMYQTTTKVRAADVTELLRQPSLDRLAQAVGRLA